MAEALPQMNFKQRGNKLCIDHVNDELQFVCKDCNETLVCSTCISTTHSGHRVVAIRLIVQEKFNRLQDLNTSIQDIRIPQMLRKIETAENETKEAKQGIRFLKKNAIDHGNYLKELIEKSTAKTVSELDDIENKITREFEKFKHESEMYIQLLQELMKENQQATQSDKNILILDIEKHSTIIDEPKFELRAPKMKFVKGTEAEFNIKAAFGTLRIEILKKQSSHQSTESVSSKTPNLKLMNSPVISTQTDLKFQPQSIVRRAKGDVWMCEFDTPNLHTLDGDNFVKTVKLDVYIRDISIHPSTDQFYCLSVVMYSGHNSVRTVNTHNRMTTKLFRIREQPFCMAVTDHSGHILVGTRGKQLVTLYTDTGTVVQTIETINEIEHISVCRTSGYVAMSCFESGVMVMDRELRHMYTCKPSGANFYAMDADFDNVGHLLIASYNNTIIYIADSTTGDILKSIPVDNGYPRCLTTQCDATVLIGTAGTSRDVLYNMKYTVKWENRGFLFSLYSRFVVGTRI